MADHVGATYPGGYSAPQGGVENGRPSYLLSYPWGYVDRLWVIMDNGQTTAHGAQPADSAEGSSR
jgi:hypothetical protein